MCMIFVIQRHDMTVLMNTKTVRVSVCVFATKILRRPPCSWRYWSLPQIVNHCGICSVFSSGFASCLASCVCMTLWQTHHKKISE